LQNQHGAQDGAPQSPCQCKVIPVVNTVGISGFAGQHEGLASVYDKYLIHHDGSRVNAPERFFLPDMQASLDHRELAIRQVGIKGPRYPFALVDASGEAHPTVATLAMTVGLPPEVKGTHMSRFVELLERPRAALTLGVLRRMLGDMLLHLQAHMNLEELVRIAEEQASCEVFGLLKRPDEKWVTERAYDSPKFAEDLVRDIALRLRDEPRVGSWTVSSENFESIHNHSAYALIEGHNA
jgi:GTP cyclohydrolase FolE2